MNTFKSIILTLLGVPLTLLSQQRPDFSMEELYPLEAQTRVEVRASARMYANENSLTLVVEVKDPHINLDPSPLYTDHIELWLALPSSAYPPNFEYAQHSTYIHYPDYSRDQATPRFFSIDPSYTPQLKLETFVNNFDYPSGQLIRREGLKVPPPAMLRKEEVHYGIVQYGIYPNQDPRLLNRGNLALLENSIGRRLANLASGLVYSVDWDHNSYTINVEITPEALGFVTLPELQEMRMMIDIFDTGTGGRSRPVLSSAEHGIPGRPETFNRVRLRAPLRTNMTDIPDDFFLSTGYRPVMMRGEREWIPTTVDTDALVYKEQASSQTLLEVKFSEQPFHYSYLDQQGISLQRLIVNTDYVNAVSDEREFILLNGQRFSANRLRQTLSPLDTLKSNFFRFPDGDPGIIIRETLPMDPYGWGHDGHLINESIRIHRVNDRRSENILFIQQGEGQNPFCVIQGIDFGGYYISKLDWIRKGKILVLILTHWETGYPKRVKVSWEDDGSDVLVEAID